MKHSKKRQGSTRSGARRSHRQPKSPSHKFTERESNRNYDDYEIAEFEHDLDRSEDDYEELEEIHGRQKHGTERTAFHAGIYAYPVNEFPGDYIEEKYNDGIYQEYLAPVRRRKIMVAPQEAFPPYHRDIPYGYSSGYGSEFNPYYSERSGYNENFYDANSNRGYYEHEQLLRMERPSGKIRRRLSSEREKRLPRRRKSYYARAMWRNREYE